MRKDMGSVKSLSEVFDRVVCINLDRRPDRWQEFQSQLGKIEWPFAPVQRVRAVDGSHTKSPSWLKCGGGAWGCLRSHIRILEDALQDGVSSLLILEDDAMFPADFVAQTHRFFQHVPSDWDSVMLGGEHCIRPSLVSEHIVRVHNANCTHAHALRGRYIEAVYQHLSDFVEYAKFPLHHVDTRLGNLHLRGDYQIYAPNPWIVGQSRGASDISGRMEGDRTWQHTIRVKPLSPVPVNEALRKQSETIPLVAVTGLYRSGCLPVIGTLQKLGGFLGDRYNRFLEDEDLQALSCYFFSEPKIKELVPSRGRQQMLRQWATAKRIAAAKRGHSFVAAKQPLLSMFASDLLAAWGQDTKFILVERDFEEAIDALEKVNWKKFRGQESRTQQRLRQAQDDFFGKHEHLLINYHQLRANPQKAVEQIVDYLQLSSTKEQFEQAIGQIWPTAK
ncbi:MAG: glycosyltransferase family 25 protein [Pirellulales bacterium]|nr:glycosyltransferase family 25 protein [Pirellulales bacterium]